MATIPRAHARDRSLYVWMAVFIPVVVLIGFARTYYLKGFFGTPSLPSLLVHFHGAVMTAWVVLFMTQVWLISSRRTKVHQRLGICICLPASRSTASEIGDCIRRSCGGRYLLSRRSLCEYCWPVLMLG